MPAWLVREWRERGSVFSRAVQESGKAAHARRERREAWVLADQEFNAYAGSAGSVGEAWPHLRQIIRLVRERRLKGKQEREVSYAITSLPPQEADAAFLLCQQREYWGIENRLHWVRDVTLGEDLSQIRSQAAPQVCASLRNLTITLLRRGGSENIAASLRTNSSRPRATVAAFLAATRP